MTYDLLQKVELDEDSLSTSNTMDEGVEDLLRLDIASNCSSPIRTPMSPLSPIDSKYEQELIASACGGHTRPEEVKEMDISKTIEQRKKSLKSLYSLSQYSFLMKVNLSNNAIRTMAGLESFPNLEECILARNQLKRIDAPFSQLPKLRRLNLAGNFISHLPEEISQLDSLEELDISGNNLKVLKEMRVLASLSQLHQCNFSANPMCRLPTYRQYIVYHLPTLEKLDGIFISEQLRDDSRHRYQDPTFARERYIKETNEAFMREQQRLCDARNELEVENQRLKKELEIKSKLLQNKTKAWSAATEQLAELQKDVAMMNLDTRLPSRIVQEQSRPISANQSLFLGKKPKDGSLPLLRRHSASNLVVQQTRADDTLPPSKPVEFSNRSYSSFGAKEWIHEKQDSLGAVDLKPNNCSTPTEAPYGTDMGYKRTVASRTRVHGSAVNVSPMDLKSNRQNGNPTSKNSLQPKLERQCSSKRNEISKTATDACSQLTDAKENKLNNSTPSEPLYAENQPQVDADRQRKLVLTLHSYQQTLLSDIAQEEDELHKLKSNEKHLTREKCFINAKLEDSEEAYEYNRWSDNHPDACLQASDTFGIKKRDLEYRSQIDALREKLQSVENKEKSIEFTLMELTKQALKDDSGTHGHSLPLMSAPCIPDAFSKEISDATNDLEVIVTEKEEICSELNRIMRAQQSALAYLSQQHTKQDEKAHLRKSLKKLETELKDIHAKIRKKEKIIKGLKEKLQSTESQFADVNKPLSPAKTPPQMQYSTPTFFNSPTRPIKPKSEMKDVLKKVRKTGDLQPKLHDEDHADTSAITDSATNTILEELKQDIYVRLAQQLATRASATSKRASSTHLSPLEINEAIKDELSNQIKLAMDNYKPSKCGTDMKRTEVQDIRHLDNDFFETIACPSVHLEYTDSPKIESRKDVENDISYMLSCTLDADSVNYTMKYHVVKDLLASTHANQQDVQTAARTSALYRVRKTYERLLSVQQVSNIDPSTFIEMDSMGNKRSFLKVVLHAARDLPTAHLRTQNLDPYVLMEIVYSRDRDLKNNATKVTTNFTSRSQLKKESASTFRARSCTQKQTLYPSWDEEFMFSPVESLSGYLDVRVMNDRRTSEGQTVCETKIPLITLIHQRCTSKWYKLRIPAVTPSSSISPRSGCSWNGQMFNRDAKCEPAIHLQLQLTFSRVEQLKRALDELIGKYIQVHGELPPFVQPLKDDALPAVIIPTCKASNANLSTTCHGLSNNEDDVEDAEEKREPSPTPCNASKLAKHTEHTAKDCQSSSRDTKEHERIEQGFTCKASKGNVVKSCNRMHDKNQIDTLQPSMMYNKRKPVSSSNNVKFRSTHRDDNQNTHDVTQASHRVRMSSPPKEKVARANSMYTSFSNRGYAAQSSVLDSFQSARSSSSLANKECFDEYSPYHPSVNGLDGMAIIKTPLYSSCKRSIPSRLLGKLNSPRKTDLSIFKSPAYAKLHSTPVYSDRYIGIDNQTSERMKRIFGRFDSPSAYYSY